MIESAMATGEVDGRKRGVAYLGLAEAVVLPAKDAAAQGRSL